MSPNRRYRLRLDRQIYYHMSLKRLKILHRAIIMFDPPYELTGSHNELEKQIGLSFTFKTGGASNAAVGPHGRSFINPKWNSPGGVPPYRPRGHISPSFWTRAPNARAVVCHLLNAPVDLHRSETNSERCAGPIWGRDTIGTRKFP